jgi:hypothetical protein
MANVPSIKRFRSEDYPGIDEKFLSNLNILTESIVNALTGGINFTNIAGDLFERKPIIKNTDISPSRPLKIQWTKALPPAAVFCGGIWLKGADQLTSLGLNITLDWSYDAEKKMLLIKKVNGLTLPSATNEYELTIVCFCK